jgi:hypothetical protein
MMNAEFSAVRKSRNAEETAQRLFQTTNLIISHFKRDSEKQQIYQLTGEKNTLTKLLVGSAAIHCYDFMGIRTRATGETLDSLDAHHALELLEKKDLFQEISTLVDQAVEFEIELTKIALDYERQILDVLVNEIDITNEDFIITFKDLLEENLVEALNKYPIVLFYDHIGELTGFLNDVKFQILEEMAGLKPTSLDLETDLVRDHAGDRYIELSTLNRLVAKLKQIFEFGSVRDLKVETFSIRKMVSKIIAHQFEYYPISRRGLKAFQRASQTKEEIYKRFLDANHKEIEYNQFENDTLDFIIGVLKEQIKISEHNFVYFLQHFLGYNFAEVADLLNRFGISDLTVFAEIQDLNLSQFLTDCKMFQITKMDFIQLNKSSNILTTIQDKLNSMKKAQIITGEHNLEEMFAARKPEELEWIKQACHESKIEFDDVQKLYQKKMIIKLTFGKKYPVRWLNGYIMLNEIAEIYQNLGHFLYYQIMARICRQTARIMESFEKLKEDKNLYLLGLKRILDSGETDRWVLIKIEELMIERLMKRQEELAIVFNAENLPFLVNAFIWARLNDLTTQECITMLTKDPSPIYEGIGEYPLPADMVSPVSYIIAFDLLQRMKITQELKKMKVEQRQELKDNALEQKKQELKKAQELNTLNFIEKKITSTIMIIKNGEMNPTALYWSEKDQKMAAENIKLHSELKGRSICRQCFKDTTDGPCKEHNSASVPANTFDLLCQFYAFSLQKISELWPKLKVPEAGEIREEVRMWLSEASQRRLHREFQEKDAEQIIEGERVEAAKKIAQSVGEYLDKALYKKFKDTSKKSA